MINIIVSEIHASDVHKTIHHFPASRLEGQAPQIFPTICHTTNRVVSQLKNKISHCNTICSSNVVFEFIILFHSKQMFSSLIYKT